VTTPHLTHDELSAWLDGVLDLTPAQQAHRTSCPECLRAVERLQGLRRVAREAMPDVPTDRMWREIEARTAGTAPGRRRLWSFPAALRGYRLPVAGLGTVATILLVLVIARPTPEPIKVPEVAAPIPTAAPVPAQPERRKAEKKSAASVPPPARDEGFSKSAADQTAGASAPATEPATQPAAATQPAPSRAMKSSRAPAATRQLANEAEAPPARVTWRGQAVIIIADREEHPVPDRLVFSGHVLITPNVMGSPYVALVDGLARTMTGRTESSGVTVHLPQEQLILSH